jgi:hypothetical protein
MQSAIGGTMASHPVLGSRTAVTDRTQFTALQRVPARAAETPAGSDEAGSAPELPKHAWRALVACALWLHIGFIGALCAAAGLVLLAGGEMATLPALCVAIVGGAIALVAWRRGRSVLERNDRNLHARPYLAGC